MPKIRSLKNIDPEMARGLMSSCLDEDDGDESRVHAIAQQMKRGRLDPYGISIELDEKGRLREGALYLKAIIESGSTVRMWVEEDR